MTDLIAGPLLVGIRPYRRWSAWRVIARAPGDVSAIGCNLGRITISLSWETDAHERGER